MDLYIHCVALKETSSIYKPQGSFYIKSEIETDGDTDKDVQWKAIDWVLWPCMYEPVQVYNVDEHERAKRKETKLKCLIPAPMCMCWMFMYQWMRCCYVIISIVFCVAFSNCWGSTVSFPSKFSFSRPFSPGHFLRSFIEIWSIQCMLNILCEPDGNSNLKCTNIHRSDNGLLWAQYQCSLIIKDWWHSMIIFLQKFHC